MVTDHKNLDFTNLIGYNQVIMKRTTVYLVLLFCLHQSFSQQRTVYISDIIEEAIFSDKEEIVYSNVDISYGNLPELPSSKYDIYYDLYGYLSEKYPHIPKDSLGRIIVEKPITLTGVSGYIEFQKFSFKSSFELYNPLTNTSSLSVHLDSCLFESISIGENIGLLTISRCSLKASKFNLRGRKKHSTQFLSIEFYENRIIGNCSFRLQGWDSFYMENNTFTGAYELITNHGRKFDNHSIIIELDSVERAYIVENSFLGDTIASMALLATNSDYVSLSNNDFDSVPMEINSSTITNLQIENNSFNMPLFLTSSVISDRLNITENEFEGGFGLTRSLLPVLYVDIDWSQMAGNKLFIRIDTIPALNRSCDYCISYFGETNVEMSNKKAFRELVGTYTELYRINRENGDTESFNGFFADLQKLYTRRYDYLYMTNGGLKNWFKWRLNQVLEFYVDYGTDPARAIVISFYIIMGFAVFYFFFPSEWDVTSKQKLVEQIRSAINKHEKGTSKAVVKATGLLFLSFINAFTLSLNSFVTLGFGTIPTTGLARYVCIVQGFMGWFLLSLFTVALINQVIF